MARNLKLGSGYGLAGLLALGSIAGAALAQPSITSLGSGVPLGVTNSLSGTYYIGGSGQSTTAAARWSLTGSTLTSAEIAGTLGGGYISKDDGAYMTTLVLNGPTRWAVGNAVTGVTPAFTPMPAGLAASSTLPPTTAPGGARWSFATNSNTVMGPVPVIPFTANPNLPPVTISTIACSTGVATATTAAAHGLAVNDIAIIAGDTVSAYNGVFKVTAVPTSTTFQYTGLTCGLAGTGGTVVKQVLNIGNSGVYGPSSANGAAPDSSSFLTPNAISSNGRFIVGLAYACIYNTAGTSISATSFYWRPVIWDAQGNGGAGSLSVLPTPFRTSTSTGANTRRRTGNPYAVSNDGLVIAGATEHNGSVTPNADSDGGRFCVWRWNSGTSSYDMTYLDTGVDANGFPKGLSSTPGSLAMNSAGTIIAARGPDGITKWVWNGSTWGAPIVLGSNLSTPASWLPASVTSCGVPPSLGGSLAMSEDGNTIVGSAVYSTCGSFMSGGFIWTAGDNLITDWYDYNVSIGTPGVAPGGFYGPIGDFGDPSKGLPVIGYPLGISPDGNAVVGFQGGTQRIVGAPPWIMQMTGGPTCVAPSITSNPSALSNFSSCSSSIILNVSASGTTPITYQWYKDGSPLSDGTTAGGSTVVGATTFQLRVNGPLAPTDAGTYYAVVTGQCGSPATTTNAVVQVDPAFPAAPNDICSSALTVTQGTNVLGAGESPCGAFINDPFSGASCTPNATSKSDRWYRFTPASSGNFRIETCGSNFDTVVTVFDSCGGTELACNNDYTTGPTTGCTSTRSRIASVALAGGTPYLIRVAAPTAAFLSSTNLINLSINPAPAPAANDVCGSATAAVIGANAYDLTEATNDWIASCNTALSRDVWFSYVQPASGTIKLSTCGTTLNTVMSVYNACYGSEIACNDNSGLASCTNQAVLDNFPVAAHTPIYIRIGASSATAVGSGNLTITAVGCDSIDFNNDGLFPDTGDIDDFLNVFSGGPCTNDPNCGDIDFNNDGLFPDTMDIDALLSVFSGGACLS